MKTLKTISPELPVRVGMSLTFLWSGYDLIRNPENWTWAFDAALVSMPKLVKDIFLNVDANQFLQVQGIIEIIFAVLLLSWFVPHRIIKLVVFVIALHLSAIIFLVGINTITFRDIGLLGASLSIFLISNKKA